MKNRSIAQIILINFFKTIGVIVLLLGVGVLSYYLTMLFLKQTQRVERSTQYEHVIDVNPGSMESSNLIYSYDKKSGKIEEHDICDDSCQYADYDFGKDL